MATLPTKCDVAVIGAGPAGLMAAEQLGRAGFCVNLYERMPTPARKFLMAGKSGLNLTHSEDLPAFTKRYGNWSDRLARPIKAFSNTQIRQWAHDLGIETFVGSSGRVFPKTFKASPLLRAWLKRLNSLGVELHTRTTWQGWNENGDHLVFVGPNGTFEVDAQATILALGGTSWPKLGSVGEWQQPMQAIGVAIEQFRPVNCGFNVDWSAHFRERFAGQPVKNCLLSFNGKTVKGDVMITNNGIEGGTIYKVSAAIVAALENGSSTAISLDLAPDQSTNRLKTRLSEAQGKRSLTDHIRRKTGLKGVQIGLLREFAHGEPLNNPEALAAKIKSLQVPITSARPIEEAISVAGGVSFAAMDENLMLNALPGTFCAGEMVAWDAPTGGYLLSASLAQGKQAAEGAINWLKIGT